MPETIFIHEKLKQCVEEFLLADNPLVEHGGVFLGHGFELILVRFIPNTSNSPRDSYLFPNNFRSYLDLDKKLTGLDLEVHFHTHPSHSVLSGRDVDVARNTSYSSKYNIIITHDAKNAAFTWHCYDGYEEQYLEVISKEYDVFKEYFARSLGMTRLGEIFISDAGDMMIPTALGKAVLEFDKDAFNVYNLVKDGRVPTKKEMQETLGITVTRLDKAIARLRKFNLMKERK